MRKRILFAFVMVISCLCVMTSTTFAVTDRASDQISSYYIDVIPTTGSIGVSFSVSGNRFMEKIGCESIDVYEKDGSEWELVESWDEDDEGMSVTNSPRHRNAIYCNGETGVEYKVVVTIFAEDDVARDTRTKTSYVTGR